MGSLFSSPEPSPTYVTVSTPEKSDTEKQLLELQYQILQQQRAGSPEQDALYAKSAEYYQQMLADQTLSPEEEAEFDKEYNLQLQALNEQYGRETKEYGGTQMASLLARGMWDTTTGTQEMGKTQEQFATILGEQTAGLLESKETAKYSMDLAKRQMVQSGYELSSGLNQNQLQTALQASMSMQNYYLNQGSMQAQSALQNALSTQTMQQAQYKQRMNLFSGMTGLGMGLMKGGILGG